MFLFGYSPHKNGELNWLDDLIFLPLRIGIRSEDLQDFFERSVKGSSIALSSPRLVIPAAIYGLWELSQHFTHDLFDFQVMLCTFMTFELTPIYTFNLRSWLIYAILCLIPLIVAVHQLMWHMFGILTAGSCHGWVVCI